MTLNWFDLAAKRIMGRGALQGSPIYIEKLNKMDLLDWRLPTLQEAIPLMEPAENKSDGLYIDPLFGETQKRIWTADKQGASSVRVVNFSYGYCYFSHVVNLNVVRAVR